MHLTILNPRFTLNRCVILDHLDDFELAECYKIFDTALRCLHGEHRATSKVMESFIMDVNEHFGRYVGGCQRP